MTVNSSPPPAREDPAMEQQLRTRIQHSIQQIRIGEVEHAVVKEIVAYANFDSLHNELTEAQRQHLLTKYWAELQSVEQRLHARARYELELAHQELIRDYTPQLTHVTETIRSLQPTSEVHGMPEHRLLTKLETIQHNIHQLQRAKR